MRLVNHLAVETERAEIRIIGEGRDDFLGPGTFRSIRFERRIDDVDMLGMDQGFRRKTVAPRGARFLFEAGKIFDIGVNSVDGGDLGGGGAHQAHVAGKQIRTVEFSGAAVFRGAQRRGQILRTLHQAGQSWRTILVGTKSEHRFGGFGGNDDDPGCARLRSGSRLERIKP